VTRLILLRQNIDINSIGKHGYSALSLASIKGYDSLVRLLLGVQDIDIDAHHDKHGKTATVSPPKQAMIRLLNSFQKPEPVRRTMSSLGPLPKKDNDAIDQLFSEAKDSRENQYPRPPLSTEAFQDSPAPTQATFGTHDALTTSQSGIPNSLSRFKPSYQRFDRQKSGGYFTIFKVASLFHPLNDVMMFFISYLCFLLSLMFAFQFP
jgi:hypothetical protein